MCRFLYNAPFSLCHVSKCEMIIYVYIDAFIRSHESNQFALLITEGTGSSLWRFFTFLVARYVVFLTTCGAADAVRLSMLTVLCFFTDCHIIYKSIHCYQVPPDSGSTLMRGPDN